ncbi:hypothetical protein [Streptomyces sp. NPDC056160]|uniref:hypothetical protein n=1 Tax=Streptomyces sp. NPDC056160 TaxID=3345731 RepID=UPI0035DEE0C6
MARQYTGTAGKVTDCQVGVSVHLATDRASATDGRSASRRGCAPGRSAGPGCRAAPSGRPGRSGAAFEALLRPEGGRNPVAARSVATAVSHAACSAWVGWNREARIAG